jgi:hypothetical protein
MKRGVWGSHLLLLVGTAMTGMAVVLTARSIAADKAVPKAPAGPGKAVVPAFDRPKSTIERPTQRLLARQTSVAARVAAHLALPNPKVEAGKVRWHQTFADACAAARKSGKPVLLFQMMGKLDERFC